MAQELARVRLSSLSNDESDNQSVVGTKVLSVCFLFCMSYLAVSCRQVGGFITCFLDEGGGDE